MAYKFDTNESGTSSVSSLPESSSSIPPANTLVTDRSFTPPSTTSEKNGFSEYIEKWGIPFLGILLSGVFGYFSAILHLKDDIDATKYSVGKVEKDVEFLKLNDSQTNDSLKQLPELKIDIAVIKSKLDSHNTSPRK
jgi:hypothetical protein